MSKSLFKFILVSLIITLFTSCGGGLNGTYVPKNDAARQSMFSKFIFKGNKVKVVMGTAGIEMPGGYEYTFNRSGDKVSIEMKVMGVSMGGIDLNYNEKKNELSLLLGGEVGTAINEYAPVWGKEGNIDPKEPESESASQSVFGKIKKSLDNFFRRNPAPSHITLNKTFLELENTGASEQLIATVYPVNVLEKNKKLIWESGDKTIATVDSTGLVTAVANGSTVISVNTFNGLSDTCYVTIIVVTGVKLNKTALSLKEGATEQLTATLFPAEVSEKNIKIVWQSDNDVVAKVDANGFVTAVTNGHAVISVYTNNGLSDACSVQVKNKKDEDKKPIPGKKVPTTAQLNHLLNQIAEGNDSAIDEMRKILGNDLFVNGVANISNVQQLITDASNGTLYRITDVNTDSDGKITSITVSK